MSTVIEYASANEILAAATVLPALAIVAVAARFYARYLQRVPCLTDDWLTIPALLCVLGIAISLIVGVAQQAVGYPTPSYKSKEQALTETLPQIVTTAKIEYINQFLAIPALGLIKLSVVFFCRRIFVVDKRQKGAFNIVTWVYVAVIVIWTLLLWLQTVEGCNGNVDAEWASAEVQAKLCPSTGEEWVEAFAMSDFITDVFIIALPMPMVWRLHATPSMKLAVSAVFAVGLLAVAASTARFVIYTKLVFNTVDRHLVDRDLWISAGLYWTMIETSLSLIAACLPSLRPMIGSKAIDSMIRSLRSAISLRSSNSASMEHSTPSNQPSSGADRAATDVSQRTYVQTPDTHSIDLEAYPMKGRAGGDGTAEYDIPELPTTGSTGGVRVTKEVKQTVH